MNLDVNHGGLEKKICNLMVVTKKTVQVTEHLKATNYEQGTLHRYRQDLICPMAHELHRSYQLGKTLAFQDKYDIIGRMVGLAQMVRASDCGPEGRRFDPDIPPQVYN